MKLKAVITDGAPEPVVAVMSFEFAERLLNEVAVEILGAENAIKRPSEWVTAPQQTENPPTEKSHGM